MELDVNGLSYREVNDWLRRCEQEGVQQVTLHKVQGQRYIGTGLANGMRIDIEGTPGNDLGAFLDGCSINVHGNAQDAVGNTMNAGRIVVHGRAGDVVGHSARGGEILVRSDAGYRVGIHMKASNEKGPLLVIGGMVRDFTGEYMAGGTLVILGLESRMLSLAGSHLGTGMHGGVMYLRGEVEPHKLGREVSCQPVTEDDRERLRQHLAGFCDEFDFDLEEVLDAEFCKLVPLSTRPYGRLYVGSVGSPG
jgi:glutamate synthase domain-containing protein 3